MHFIMSASQLFLSVIAQRYGSMISGPPSPNPLPINLNLYPTQIHCLRTRTCPLYPRRQPPLRLLVVPRPLRHYYQKRQGRASKPKVECRDDVLREEADEEAEDAGCGEEESCEVFGEALAGEVLRYPVSGSEGFGGWTLDGRFALRRYRGLVPRRRPWCNGCMCCSCRLRVSTGEIASQVYLQSVLIVRLL